MRYTTEDIKSIRSFAERLQTACDDIMDGTPKSQACEQNEISLSMFNQVMHGQRRVAAHKKEAEPSEEGRLPEHPVWQDKLADDIGGDEDTVILKDFEETLEDISEKYLTEGEWEVIKLYYEKHLTIKETADTLKISVSAVSERKKKALRKLRRHSEELLKGNTYNEDYRELTEKYQKHLHELDWIRDALDYLSEIDADKEAEIDDMDISDEAKDFYNEKGFVKLSDVMPVSLQDLFTVINDSVTFPGIINSFSADTPIEDLGIKNSVVAALKYNDICTVHDMLSTPPDELTQIPHVTPGQLLKAYYRLLTQTDANPA